MIDVLLSEDLWFIVCGEDKGPGEGGSAEKKVAWKARSARAAASIRLAMDDKVRARYTEDKYPVDPVALWAKVEEDHKALVALDKNFLLTQLYDCKLEEHGTVASYVDALNAIVDNLRTCGKTVDDDDRWFYLTNGLPASWSVFRRVVEGTAGSQKRNVETLITKMLAEEAQLKRDQGLGADSALYAGKPGVGQGRGRPGISRRNEEQRDAVECFYCREKGHVKRECAKYAAVECFYCQRKGHMKRECQKYKEDKDSGMVESQGAPSGQGQSSIARVVEDKLWSVTVFKGLPLRCEARTDAVWTVDSGCTRHITGNKERSIPGEPEEPGELGEPREPEEPGKPGEPVEDGEELDEHW